MMFLLLKNSQWAEVTATDVVCWSLTAIELFTNFDRVELKWFR